MKTTKLTINSMSKGDMITFPIQIINRMGEYWGDDAHQFRPERWSQLPDTVKDMPGVYSNLFTFFAGTHACIGYRFSLTECVPSQFHPPSSSSAVALGARAPIIHVSLTSHHAHLQDEGASLHTRPRVRV